jgi:hypothetical protein
MEVNLVRGLAPQRPVPSVLIVPIDHQEQLGAHALAPRGNSGPLQPFLDRAHGSFQNGNTAMFPQGPETWPDRSVTTSLLVASRGKKLAALVADQVSRGAPGDAN